MTTGEIPSLVGFRPEDAEKAIVESGFTFCWIDSEKPKWLSPCHEARVGRQRNREDGTVELLCVYIPILSTDDDIADGSE